MNYQQRDKLKFKLPAQKSGAPAGAPSFLSCTCRNEGGIPIVTTSYPLAATAAGVAAAAVVVVSVAAATAAAAVAEDQQQDNDPPPVVTAEAATDTIIIAHKITSDSFR